MHWEVFYNCVTSAIVAVTVKKSPMWAGADTLVHGVGLLHVFDKRQERWS